MTHSRTPILILGIGNILLQDEGIGVRVIESLRREQLPENVELVDGGTAGADLLDILSDRQTVLIIDAAQSEAAPGTLLKFSPEQFLSRQQALLSLHELDIPQTLKIARLLGCAPESVIIFGIVPDVVAPGLELTDTLQKKLPFYTQTILQELNTLTESGVYSR